MKIVVRTATKEDIAAWARLRNALWPDATTEEHARELTAIFDEPRGDVAINLVAEASDRTVVGFLEADLRSHADGCDPKHAVGFIEGWYVMAEYRGRGAGRQLLETAEEWARQQGCTQMASDTWIDNELSQKVHEALGYEEVDRCVHYRKRIG